MVFPLGVWRIKAMAESEIWKSTRHGSDLQSVGIEVPSWQDHLSHVT